MERDLSVDLIKSGAIKGKEALEILDEGEFLYHGSTDKIEELEPRQAFNWSSGVKVPDGEPAVFATDNYERAIFMAVLRGLQGSQGTDYDNESREYRYKMNRKKVDQLNKNPNVTGYVMVLPKENFTNEGADYRSEVKIKPKYFIEVNSSDLPKNIEVTEDD